MSKPRTLIELLKDGAGHDPEAEAFLFQQKSYSYRELWEAVVRVASSLLARGLERRSRIVISLPNGPEFFAVFYGAQLAGAIPVPTFPGSGLARLLSLAERCGATTIVTVERHKLEHAAGGSEETLSAESLVRGGTGEAGTGRYATGNPRSTVADFPHVGAEDIAYIQFTSGTTGEPKGVQLSHANVLVNTRQLTAGFGITAEDIFVSWLPAYHDMGLVLMTMVPIALGARLILLPASLRSLRPWLSAIEAHQGTFTAAPDFGYRMALRMEGTKDLSDLSSLRVALNAAEPVRASTIDSFERTYGLEGVMIAGYGLAEATVGVSAWEPGKKPLVDEKGAVSVGKPFPEVEVTVLRGNHLVGSEELGEILVTSPANTKGYWGEDPARSDLVMEDGSLRTGDLGYLDSDGNLFVAGRLKQMILQAGRNIAPREVEEIVDSLPFVRRSAAVGIDRGDAAGEQLYLFTEMREGSRPDDEVCRDRVVSIVDSVHSHLGLRPGRVYLTARRTIPFTANGKVRYIELKEAYQLGLLRQAGKLWYPEW